MRYQPLAKMMLQKFSVLHLPVFLCTISIFSNLPLGAVSVVSEIPPPAAAVFMMGVGNSENKTLLSDTINSDVEVEPGRSMELECYANHPIQWHYRGRGRPQFTSNITVDELNSREVYKASLLISNANEKDTGSYVCSYTEYSHIASSYHLFIPGNDIFIAESGRTIPFSNDMTYVTIPCPITVKSAKITLRKVYYDNSLRNIDAPIANFDPRAGFKLNIKDLRDSEGVYVCTGYVNGTIQLREFILRNQDRNQTSVTFPEGIQEEINPCLSYSCPGRSRCRVNLNTNLPFCACRKGSTALVTNCTRLCKTSQECPKSEKCQFSIEKQLKMCVHVCDDHKCVDHAECYADEQRGLPKCRCKRGFQGNGNVLCERIPFKMENDTTSYCSTAKCGPNARCRNVNGKSQCTCSLDALGVWPNCQRACITDTDCGFQDKCTEKGVCEHVCSENMCAPKAECKVLHRKPMCLCPPGYTGKATEACYPSHYYFSSRSGAPAESSSSLLLPPDLEETTTVIAEDFIGDPVSPVINEEGAKSLKLSLPTDD